ncbi:hypothetical protein like AT5G43650 [Hibiscus trionum]|uniref:BHLH domain-containing protein n=1 Tax=Hibiscus trionum TaxID=183268 RepID=A0A9W7IT88_HIBTR|nr:hypothetical protein like AT5G43650 [Hibiscus trionum]
MDQLIMQLLHGENESFWYETIPVTPTAFQPYPTTPGIQTAAAEKSGNMNKRMIEFLRKIAKDDGNHRGFKHKMNERTRREKEKKCYFTLYSMLPPGTKNDKNSIVQMATKRVQELQLVKKDLEERNKELQADNEGNKIRVRIGNPTCGVDSMLEALKCLKMLDSKPRTIRCSFTDQEFLAVLDTATQTKAADVEKAVTTALQEAERKLKQQQIYTNSEHEPYRHGREKRLLS